MAALTRYRLAVTGHEGYPKAEVTGGGLPLSQLDCATLESRRAPGVYVCGELCDVFGRIGGFSELVCCAVPWLAGWLAGWQRRGGRGGKRPWVPLRWAGVAQGSGAYDPLWRLAHPAPDVSAHFHPFCSTDFYWAWLSGRLAGLAAAEAAAAAAFPPPPAAATVTEAAAAAVQDAGA